MSNLQVGNNPACIGGYQIDWNVSKSENIKDIFNEIQRK